MSYATDAEVMDGAYDGAVMQRGTVWTLDIRSQRLADFVEANVTVESYQWLTDTMFAGDWRPMQDLCWALQQEHGFRLAVSHMQNAY